MELSRDGSALCGLKRKLSYDSSHNTDDARDSKARALFRSPTQRAAGNQPGYSAPQSPRGARLAIRAPKPSADQSGGSPAAEAAANITVPQPDVEAGKESENISLHLESAEPCTPRAFSCSSSIFTPEKEERLQQQQQLRSWSAGAASRSLFMAQMNSPKAAPYSCDRASTPTSRKDSPRWMCPPTSILQRLQAMAPPQRRADTGPALSSPSCPNPATPNKCHSSYPGSLDPVAALQQWLQLQVSCSDATLGKQRGQLPAACHEAARQASMHRMM